MQVDKFLIYDEWACIGLKAFFNDDLTSSYVLQGLKSWPLHCTAHFSLHTSCNSLMCLPFIPVHMCPSGSGPVMHTCNDEKDSLRAARAFWPGQF